MWLTSTGIVSEYIFTKLSFLKKYISVVLLNALYSQHAVSQGFRLHVSIAPNPPHPQSQPVTAEDDDDDEV